MRHLLFLLILFPVFGIAQELKILRSEYPNATTNEQTLEALSKSLASVTRDDEATLMAFKGALLTIKAKFSKSVKDKKTHFTNGVSLIENAIAKAPENIEIRCLRMGVQENSPKFLKYNSNIELDKKHLIDHFASVKNKEIKNFIRGFVKLSKHFTEAEKQLF
jgi:hypothetical protein